MKKHLTFFHFFFLFLIRRAPDEITRIREIFPQAELKFLDTGHLVQVEAPNEFVKLAVDFINATWHFNSITKYLKKLRSKPP